MHRRPFHMQQVLCSPIREEYRRIPPGGVQTETATDGMSGYEGRRSVGRDAGTDLFHDDLFDLLGKPLRDFDILQDMP